MMSAAFFLSTRRRGGQNRRVAPRLLDPEGTNANARRLHLVLSSFVFISPEAQLLTECFSVHPCADSPMSADLVDHGSPVHDLGPPTCISTAFSKEDFALEGESSHMVRISP